MIKLLTLTAITAAVIGSVQAQAGPGVVLQGPSTNGMVSFASRGGGTGTSCPTWRCGLNGRSLNGIVLNGLTLNGKFLNGVTLNGKYSNSIEPKRYYSSGFTATEITLTDGEVLRID